MGEGYGTVSTVKFGHLEDWPIHKDLPYGQAGKLGSLPKLLTHLVPFQENDVYT